MRENLTYFRSIHKVARQALDNHTMVNKEKNKKPNGLRWAARACLMNTLFKKKSTVNPPLHNISITALQVKEHSILRPYVLSSGWSAVQTTGTETKETYSIMIILLPLSLAPATKKTSQSMKALSDIY